MITPEQIQTYCTYATYAITIASILANLLPHPKEETANKILTVLSKLVNATALNITKFKKV